MTEPRKHLLIVYHSQTGHTRTMARAVLRGARCPLPLELRMDCVRRVGYLWPVLTAQSDEWTDREWLAELRPAVTMCHKCGPGF